MIARKPFQGRARKLVLAFDVGTTYSAISYCILDSGEVLEIHGDQVGASRLNRAIRLRVYPRYPAQEQVKGDNKIPSILYYDKWLAVRAVGAEALQQHIIEQAENEDWIKVEWSVPTADYDDMKSPYIQVEVTPAPQTFIINSHQR